jgi:hypothetical protein
MPYSKICPKILKKMPRLIYKLTKSETAKLKKYILF